ncbi:hypothetical protein TNCV_916701 [Trichonephila clavipes]|nr:hypothetical protein TNCV_916701 [Trichonephila clavipes]
MRSPSPAFAPPLNRLIYPQILTRLGCGLVFHHCRPNTSPVKLVSLFSTEPYRWIPIATGNFDSQFLPLKEAPELWQCKPELGFNLAENTQARQTL